ncbi:WS/DGAT/MGAT family O-acyltransferase [Pseudomarimonas arenosa]|uniref:diacylglycerol O-acyltransferase n=1 Tax=Pseudomarimonas arenosa TaxID=2774145 RepID=A0AAW3ZGY1_9GAMM|nr:wax ester/triacylglycerol synthase family O-acyltransferase [Pseudomarimonas arenosa]MBD8525363.1 wax ester/triacylglycerol synthase family O-acyltransferase [Pseudomarimonas arenosa]
MNLMGWATTQGEAMSNVDTAWLRMEKPGNLMMITGVLRLATPLRYKRLVDLLEQRFLAYPRFRQRAVDGPEGAHWENDAEFDITRHVTRLKLPGRADEAALQDAVSELASTPLSGDHPLWQFDLIERFEGGSVVVCRIHHCYADGMALVQVMLSLTDSSPDAKREQHWLEEEARAEPSAQSLPPVLQRLDKAIKFGTRTLGKWLEAWKEPGATAHLTHEAVAFAQELVHAIGLSDDDVTSLKGALSEEKRCAWAVPLELDEVKAVSRGFGCTVNDLLLACAAGAIRQVLLDNGEPVDGLTLRATVPVNLRPRAHARRLGNHFGLVFLDLPVGEACPPARVRAVGAAMRELKNSRQAAVSYGLLGVLGMAPTSVQRHALDLLSRKATLVATNVPGPKQPLYLAGVEVSRMMFWVPQTGSIGLGISLLSYAGKVYFGLIADRARLHDPDRVARAFNQEFEHMLTLVLLSDWEKAPDEFADDAWAWLGEGCR